MVQSSEFIKGYTEIVVCALLFERDDYLYSLVKRITECGGGEISVMPGIVCLVAAITLSTLKPISCPPSPGLAP